MVAWSCLALVFFYEKSQRACLSETCLTASENKKVSVSRDKSMFIKVLIQKEMKTF
jgi:hypothetical protein